MHINLREPWVQRVLARLTVAAWCAWAQTALLVLLGTEVAGEWSRVVVLGLLILAGISTLLWGMTQTCIPVQDAMRIGWEARDRQDPPEGVTTLHLR